MPPPRQERSIETRQRILNAALQVFATRGFDGASTREIARVAHVHQPALLYHFDSKEALWDAAVRDVFGAFQQALLEVERDVQSPRERLDRTAEVLVRFVAARPAWVAFVVHEGMQQGERSARLVQRWLLPQAYQLMYSLFGRTDATNDAAFLQRCFSILSILTGSTVIFAQRAQVQQIAGLDVWSASFIERHVEAVRTALQALMQTA